MKKAISILLVALLLSGCASNTVTEATAVPETTPVETSAPEETTPVVIPEAQDYVSRFADRKSVV